MLMYLALLIWFLLMIVQTAISQTVDPITVDPEEFLSRYGYSTPEKPEFHPIRSALTENEMHVVDTLTNGERQIIEDAFDPPAVGVVRKLKNSINFNFNEINIPDQGEITTSGGRLARVNEDTVVFTTLIKSEKADEIRVFFSEGYFPHGVKVNLFSKDDYAFNQTQLRGRLEEYGFYTTTTFSDYVILQVVIPIESVKENLYFSITKILHVDNKYLIDDGLRDCYEDANCSYANSYANIDGLRRATVKLYIIVDDVTARNCSGGQLNDLRDKDWQPFILTAHHCLYNQAQASSLDTRFYFWSASCNSGTTNPNIHIVNGANLISTNSQTDFTLLLLKKEGGNSFLGWDVGGVADDEILHSTHHPHGTFMKYSRHQNKLSPPMYCQNTSPSTHLFTRTIGGQSDHGSSGCVIVDQEGRVRGQWDGSCPDVDLCSYESYINAFGKFSASYNNNNLQYWLYNGGASVSMATIPASSLDFETINVGSSHDLVLKIKNSGTVPNYLNLEVGNYFLTGTDASQFSITNSTASYLTPGIEGYISIRFTPTSAGTKTAYFHIPHNADNIPSPLIITLTGKGNPCSEIIPIAGIGPAFSKTYEGGGNGAWYTNVANPCGFSSPGREQIYSFVAPYTGTYSINVTSADGWVDYLWTTTYCDTWEWTCIDDIISMGTYGNLQWTANWTYYILLDDENTIAEPHTFYIHFDPNSNPCLNVTTIGGIGSDNTMNYIGGGTGVWNTETNSPCGYTCPGVEQVYSFMPLYDGYYNLEVVSGGIWVDYMWSYSCNQEGWNCINDIISPGTYDIGFLSSGSTYYFLLDSETTSTGSHQFYINSTDPCVNIVPVGCDPGNFNEFGGGGTGVWNNTTPSACGFICPGAERVYSFVAPLTGLYRINVTEASGYVNYMWQSSSCSSSGWNCIGSINNPDQYGLMDWQAGSTYYILLDDEDNITGTHQFNIICPEICIDCPSFDHVIEPAVSWQTHSSSHVMNGCKIYKINAIAGYTYIFKTGCGNGAMANYDTQLTLFSHTCAQIAYSDDACGTFQSQIIWTASADRTVYLKVNGFANYYGNYTLAYSRCNSAPVQPGNISGSVDACAGTESIYSIQPVSGATYYSWTLPSGWVGNSVSNSINVIVGTSGGNISVIAENDCGSSLARSIVVSVNTVPPQPGNIFGPTPVQGGSTYNYYIEPVAGATSYLWNYTGEGTLSGTGTSINLTPINSGELSVIAGNAGCMSAPSTLDIVVTTVPMNRVLPSTTIDPPQNICYDAIQTITVGGENKYFTINNGGSVELVAGFSILLLQGTAVNSGGNLLGRITTINNYCTKAQGIVSVQENENEINSIFANGNDDRSLFRIYPNPTTGSFVIEFMYAPAENCYELEIYTSMGEKIWKSELSGKTIYEFNLLNISRGIYIVRVMNGKKSEIVKLIKQ